MSDIKCPYCELEQEINHDDGYGYDEGEMHSQECERCQREFNFTTQIMYNYSAYCLDGDCDYDEPSEMTLSNGSKYNFYQCKNCENTKLEELN